MVRYGLPGPSQSQISHQASLVRIRGQWPQFIAIRDAEETYFSEHIIAANRFQVAPVFFKRSVPNVLYAGNPTPRSRLPERGVAIVLSEEEVAGIEGCRVYADEGQRVACAIVDHRVDGT